MRSSRLSTLTYLSICTAPSIGWVICQGHLVWKPLFRLTPVGRPNAVTIAIWRVPTMVTQPNRKNSTAAASAAIVTVLPREPPPALRLSSQSKAPTPAMIKQTMNSTICHVIRRPPVDSYAQLNGGRLGSVRRRGHVDRPCSAHRGQHPTRLGRPVPRRPPPREPSLGRPGRAVADGATAVAVDGLPRRLDRWAALDVRVAWQEHARLVPGLRRRRRVRSVGRDERPRRAETLTPHRAGGRRARHRHWALGRGAPNPRGRAPSTLTPSGRPKLNCKKAFRAQSRALGLSEDASRCFGVPANELVVGECVRVLPAVGVAAEKCPSPWTCLRGADHLDHVAHFGGAQRADDVTDSDLRRMDLGRIAPVLDRVLYRHAPCSPLLL